MKKTKNTIINIALSVFMIFLFFLFFEIILRSIGFGCAITDANGDGPYIFSGDMYYMKPNYNGTLKCIEFDTKIQTNSYGFRDSEFNSEKKKILLLGDSMAFGHGVEHNETFGEILEKSLEGYDIYNLAVDGYSPKEYTEQMDNYFEEFNPELVLVALSESNDVQENCGIIDRTRFFKERRKGIGKLKDFLKKFYFIRFLEPLIENTVNLGDTATTSKQFYMVEETEVVRECNNLFKESLESIDEKARIKRKQVIFLIIPSKLNFMNSENPKFDYNKKIDNINEICSELSIKCINSIELLDSPEDIYFKEGHLNTEGHYKIAKLINEFLIENNILENVKE